MSKTMIFNTTDTRYLKYNDEKVTVIRKMTKEIDNIDEEDLPEMFLIKTCDNIEIQAFVDELVNV